MININLGEAEIVFLSPGLRVFPAQSLTGGCAAPADVVGPGGRLPGEVVLHAGVLQLLPAPLVLHHAGELLLHARHVARAVARAARGAAQEVLKQQVSLVYGLQVILDDCKLNIMRMIDIRRPRRLRQVGSTGGCCCTG